ncbi:adhesin, partial [Lactobacillus gasseri]|nr:adhesin [Lactobacillus gasseri]
QVFTVGLSKNSEQNMQLQQLKSSVNELIGQKSNNLSNPVVANLMNVLKSLIDLISILNKDNKNKN